jgi:hypothetical protein
MMKRGKPIAVYSSRYKFLSVAQIEIGNIRESMSIQHGWTWQNAKHFCRVRKTSRVVSATEARVTDRLWSLDEVIAP